MTNRKHPNDMTRGELRQLVDEMSHSALDLAQHLRVTEEGLDATDQPAARERTIAMAYGLARQPYDGPSRDARHGPDQVDVTVFGDDGLENHQLTYDQLIDTSATDADDEPCATCNGDGADWGTVWGAREDRYEAARQTWLAEHPGENWRTSDTRLALLDDQPNRDEKYFIGSDDCAGSGSAHVGPLAEAEADQSPDDGLGAESVPATEDEVCSGRSSDAIDQAQRAVTDLRNRREQAQQNPDLTEREDDLDAWRVSERSATADEDSGLALSTLDE